MIRAYNPVRQSQAARGARLAGALTMPYFLLVVLGVRTGVVPDDSVLPLLATGVVLTTAALALALYAILEIWNVGSIGTGDALMAVIYAAPVAAVTAAGIAALFYYPPLNDVSTDLARPPSFLAGETREPRSAPRPDVQSEAYPDIVGRVYPVPPTRFYPAVKEIVANRGWTIVRDFPPPDAEEATARLPRARPRSGARSGPFRGVAFGEIEAIAPTPVFGFRDRVSIRLRADDEGARIDIRSASALGSNDLGANARRIRGLYRDLDTLVQERFAGAEAPPVEPEGEGAPHTE